jgi:DNA-directed RNA polymerase alpha subunit
MNGKQQRTDEMNDCYEETYGDQLDRKTKIIERYLPARLAHAEEEILSAIICKAAHIEANQLTDDAVHKNSQCVLNLAHALQIIKSFEHRQSSEATPKENSLLQRPAKDLEISTRAANSLWADDIETIGDLIKLSERDLLYIPNLGKKCLTEIKDALATRNLKLKDG